MRSRVRPHTAFWWDVFLAMQEDKNPHRYHALRAKLTKLQQENKRLTQGISKIRQQSAMDRVTIDYLSRVTPSTRGMQKGSLETELEPPGGLRPARLSLGSSILSPGLSSPAMVRRQQCRRRIRHRLSPRGYITLVGDGSPPIRNGARRVLYWPIVDPERHSPSHCFWSEAAPNEVTISPTRLLRSMLLRVIIWKVLH
jgi:hypothetical protein